jgi:hypothetical protein
VGVAVPRHAYAALSGLVLACGSRSPGPPPGGDGSSGQGDPVVQFGVGMGGEELQSVAWSGSTFLAVGTTESFLRSTDGSHWRASSSLEICGGCDPKYVIWDGQRFVLSTAADIDTSPDSLTFTMMGRGPVGRSVWTGQLYVALGGDGISTSVDLVTWTLRQPASGLRGIAWSGSTFVAVGNGIILASHDGSAWTPAASRTMASLSDVAWSGSKFLTVGSVQTFTPPAITLVAMESVDGSTWTNDPTPAVAEGRLAWSKPLGLFVSAGLGLATSPDGTAWTPYKDPFGASYGDVLWAGDRFVAVGDNVVSSLDGRNWKVQSFSYPLYGVAWLGDRFVAVGATGVVSTSADGLSWDNNSVGLRNFTGSSVAASPNRFVVSGPTWLRSSPDLVSWSTPTSAGFVSSATSTCGGIVWAGAQFVAACGAGAMATSPDGQVWAQQQAGSTASWKDVAWTGTRLVAVGRAGQIATSPDGVAWASSASGTTVDLESVARSGSRLVAVGAGGSAISSPDGINWTAERTSTASNLQGVTWATDRFVAVGDAGTIIASADGSSWSSIAVPPGAAVSFHAAAASQDRLVVVGDYGAILAFPLPIR